MTAVVALVHLSRHRGSTFLCCQRTEGWAFHPGNQIRDKRRKLSLGEDLSWVPGEGSGDFQASQGGQPGFCWASRNKPTRELCSRSLQ